MTDQEQREFIPHVAFSIAALIFGALLTHEAIEIESGHRKFSAQGYSRRNAFFAQGIHGLAEMLGLVGSIAVSVLVLGVFVMWAVVVYRRIRARA
jgi:hypothetical protein